MRTLLSNARGWRLTDYQFYLALKNFVFLLLQDDSPLKRHSNSQLVKKEKWNFHTPTPSEWQKWILLLFKKAMLGHFPKNSTHLFCVYFGLPLSFWYGFHGFTQCPNPRFLSHLALWVRVCLCECVSLWISVLVSLNHNMCHYNATFD